MEQVKFESTFDYKLIYIVKINDETHRGLVKIGDATVSGVANPSSLSDNCEILNECAKQRIDDWTRTAGLEYQLLYTSIAIKNNGDGFRDYDVHDVLKNSGFRKKRLGNAKEWFECATEIAINAIKATKQGRMSLYANEIRAINSPIDLRPEQEEAIKLVVNHFTKHKDEQAHYLWNAKMRFGKTISALTAARQLEYSKVIIVTHRPVVKKGWLEDFNKVFFDTNDYQYGSKRNGDKSIEYLKTSLERYNKKFVYFASLQDLRGSSYVGGKFEKNDEVFEIEWDMVIIDEAHEGTQTDLGDEVIQALITSSTTTKALYLSGTPFNLLSSQSNTSFSAEEVYTWDYISEQNAKLKWVEEHLGDSNPYEGLPKMNIFTYDLGEILKSKDYVDIVDEAFSFKEFFRVYTKEDCAKYQKPYDGKQPGGEIKEGEFVHKKDVKRFLDLLVEEGVHNYPFSTKEYRENFRHTLWMLPGVKEAKALSALLKEHPVFQSFKVINVAGEGDDDSKETARHNRERIKDPLEAVEEAIKKNLTTGYTITLSCGRLTTGVTIPEWTACLMLAGSNSTSASSYLQTIFRVQSPASIKGKMKTNCYVFDFAPDRTLKIIAEACNLSARAGDKRDDKTRLGEFLNFCPVIGFDGSSMKTYSTENLLVQLKKVFIDRVVKNGFDDDKLFNANIRELTDEELDKFKDLDNIVKAKKSEKSSNEIIVNNEGMDDEEHEEQEPTPRRELTPEEKKLKQEEERARRERRKAINTLRAVAKRIPLMIYGADVDDFNEEISVEKFVEIVDDKSWVEFMPHGVTKELFGEFIKYFDSDVFAGAGLVIRRKVKEADNLPPLERVQAITDIFKTFKNPDRETVLTPWNVVNLHMGECLGGANFLKENGDEIIIDDNTGPRWIESPLENLTNDVFNKDSKILELNSKSGLYPLYAAISVYQSVLNKGHTRDTQSLWKDTLENNIYVICRTPMAAKITIRTLRGFNDQYRVNVRVIDDIVERMSKEYKKGSNSQYIYLRTFIEDSKQWKKGAGVMKFNAVIGNPPYQDSAKQQIYTDFYLLARELGGIVSLIFPTGWQEPKTANNLSKLNNNAIKKDEQIVFIDNRHDIFRGIAGAEWTNFILWKKGYNNNLNGYQRIYTDAKDEQIKMLPIDKDESVKPDEIVKLVELVTNHPNFRPVAEITSALKPYGLRTDVTTDSQKYGLPPLRESKLNPDDIKVYCGRGRSRIEMWISVDYPIPKKTSSFSTYKVFVPYAWGGMDEEKYIGGTFSDIIIGRPNEICTETYLEQGKYESHDLALKQAKYIMTRFARACLYFNKFSHHSTTAWGAVPLQDFSESWWDESIDSIEEHLFDKYNVPQNIRDYVKKHIQKKSEANIENTDD